MLSPRAAAQTSPLLWLLVSLRGRISRHVYWLAYFMILSLNAVLVGQLIGGGEASYYRLAEAATPFVILGTLCVNLAIAVKRLHDVGYSGFLALTLFVPFINFVFTIWVGLLPGIAGPNAYGDVVDSPPP